MGYRAWDRGVFTGATGPAYAPWDEWPGSDRAGDRRPLRAAILAASPHDTQPWLFDVSEQTLRVFADRRRHLGAFDPFRREMHLGVGCAIENVVLAAGAFGLAAEVRPTEGRLEPAPGTQPILAAQVALRSRQPDVAAAPLRDPLFDAIPNRRTNRGPFRDQAIAPTLLRAFADRAAGPTVRVLFVTDQAARRELAAIIVSATERIITDLEMSNDSYRWIRTGRRDVEAHRDGVTIDASGTSPLMTIAGKLLPDLGAERTDRIWLTVTRDVHTATAPVFGLVLVPID